MAYQNPIKYLKEAQLYPKKELGQNFLVDEGILQRIVNAADLPPEAHILEIGAGLGSLTYFLAQTAQRVVAVEIDKKLIPIAERTLVECENVTLIRGDILEIDLSKLELPSGYVVVANIPYYITSAIIRLLLTQEKKPAKVVLTIQEEVARRICAPVGNLSMLALSVQVFGEPKVLLKVPAGAFNPAPKIDSVTLGIDLYTEPLIQEDRLDTFFRLMKAGFSQKRKMLRNTLSGGLHLAREQVMEIMETAGVDPQRRAQTLSIEEWRGLTDAFLPHLD